MKAYLNLTITKVLRVAEDGQPEELFLCSARTLAGRPLVVELPGGDFTLPELDAVLTKRAQQLDAIGVLSSKEEG